MSAATSPRARTALAALATLLAAGALVAGEPRPVGRLDVREVAATIEAERDHVSAPVLARWIRERRPGLIVLDVRSTAAFDSLHIPTARQATLDELARRDLPRSATIVLYSEGGAHAAQGWMLLRARGYRDVYFLREGLYEWISRVIEPRLAVDATPAEMKAFEDVAPLSRYFGGVPRRGVPRSEVPQGYWTEGGGGQDVAPPAPSSASAAVARIRRRGC